MLYPKLITLSTFLAFLISFLLTYYKVEIPFPELEFLKNPHGEAEISGNVAAQSKDSTKTSSRSSSAGVPSKSQKQKSQPAASSAERAKKTEKTEKTDDTHEIRLFTAKELAKYNGEGSSKSSGGSATMAAIAESRNRAISRVQ